ncbi:sugar ABC transporter permease [Bacillus sp. ISL-40]|uniref:carbohydrate ABC transporter permease n=1 Tax=unclassified Bacillus (in: firmicutes) TaxID=185979 RepID=UPI001BECFC47|nr:MULTISPECIES: sugar ABC transporter permease [unclassified Bacillus (in: firmicutes)]MBT2699428.1 sugar ABC transporter permease [Bacillus sp. ISL-40]MBT2719916.1 sugar ABC transporter permease [Bacillus sp. ISL-46]MBT2742737.1 sugar ABC transporter permease [Bacillus sp. ISL-77]
MKTNKIYPWYFSSGAIVLYTIFIVVPSLIGIYYSFTDWNSYDVNKNFIGLENYKNIIFGDHVYLEFIKNTLIFTIFTTLAKTVLGLFLAILLVSGVKAANLHRMIIFSPQVLSFLIVGLVFKSLLDPNNGFVNTTLRSLGLDFMAHSWLGSLTWAMPSVMGVDTWKGMGYIMVLFIAGLLAIPKELYEASEMDGAGFFQRLFRITLPMLFPTVMIATVLNLTYGLRVFDIIYVLTNGGPGSATDVINTAVYSAFAKGYWGLGSALSTILFVIMAIASVFIIRIMNRKGEY